MTTMASLISQFQLLEINLISAQDLAKVSRNMRTYAVAWVHPDRKLTTRIDAHGCTNPTWNDKFVFRVEDSFLRSDMSAVMVEIYALHWFRDVHVGTVRVLVSNLIPPQTRSRDHHQLGMRFVALQVRRPSGRPQGILNVGVTVLDSTMRSMPLYTQLSTSALGYQQLMGTEDLHHNSHHQNGGGSAAATTTKLYRSKSDRSSMLGIDEDGISHLPKSTTIKGSTIRGGSRTKGSELSAVKKGKILYDKPLSVIDGASDLAVQLDVMKIARTTSTLNQSSLGPVTKSKKMAPSILSQSDLGSTITDIKKVPGSDIGGSTRFNNIPKPKHNWLEPVAGKKPSPKGYPITKDFANGSIWSESEVGPSPSEVAAAIAEDSKYRKMDHGGSSLLEDKWSFDGTEGLKTKLDRWRTELPTLYDHSSFTSTAFAPKHTRRHTDGGEKFSCFGSIGVYEFSIICGQSGPKRRSGGNKQLARSPSLDSMSTYL
ncbi:hypothetical protein Dimus_001701 [Dionaea muscipula]